MMTTNEFLLVAGLIYAAFAIATLQATRRPLPILAAGYMAMLAIGFFFLPTLPS